MEYVISFVERFTPPDECECTDGGMRYETTTTERVGYIIVTFLEPIQIRVIQPGSNTAIKYVLPVKIRWFLKLTIALSATLTSLEVTVAGVRILPGGNVMDNGGSTMNTDSCGRIGTPRADTPSVKNEVSEP